MRTLPIFLLLVAFLLPTVEVAEAADPPEPKLDFKIAKQRKDRDKKGGAANNSTSEVWDYKVEVTNRSVQPVAELEVKYTYYISTETRSGSSRKETVRKVTGTSKLKAMGAAGRATFETKKSSLKQSEKTERKKTNNKRRGSKNSKNNRTQIKVTEVREKLDGISIELYLKGKRVGGYVVGDAAKRAAAKGKKKK